MKTLYRAILLCLLLLVLCPSAQAQDESPSGESPFGGGEGVVSGQVVNGSADGQSPAGVVVRLRAFDMEQAAFIDAITTTVAADGSYLFEGIDPNAPVQLEPIIEYQGVSFLSDLEGVIVLASEGAQGVANFVIYEPSRDDSLLHFDSVHLLLEVSEGILNVTEVYQIDNMGDRVYIGVDDQGVLFFSLPKGAADVQPMQAVAGRYIETSDGLLDFEPVHPGMATSQVVFNYTLSFKNKIELRRPLDYPTADVKVFIPDDGTELSSDMLRYEENFVAQGRDFRLYTAQSLPADTLLTLTVGQSAPSQTGPLLTGAGALLLAGALAFLYLSGRLDVWLPRRSARTQARKAELIQAIAELDDAYEAGRIKEKRYRSQRKKLKDELVELMR